MAQSKSRARAKNGRFKKGGGGTPRASNRAKPRKRGSRGAARARSRSTGSRRRSQNGARAAAAPKVVYRYRAAPATAKNSSRSRGRRRGRRRNGNTSILPNPSLKGAVSILKELGYAGGGAFGVSTLSQLIPFPVTSPVMILIVQGILAYIVGWLGSKVFGKAEGALMRLGGFAYAAGNFVNNQFPNLQAKILSFSPLRPAANAQLPPGAAQAAIANGGDLSSAIMTADQLSDISLAHPYMNDISVVGRQNFGYGAGRYGAYAA